MKRVLCALLGIAAVAIGLPSSAAADYDVCGEFSTSANTTKIIKVKRMSCDGGIKLARKYEDKSVHGDDYPEPGDTLSIGNFRCQFETYFDPYEPAYKCRNSGKKGKAMRALYPPEREGLRASKMPCALQVGSDCKVEPKLIILGARAYARITKWRGWGNRRAVGTGRFENGASAGQPDSGIGPTRARVVYSRIRGCGGDPRYSHINVRYGKALKKGFEFDIYKPCQ